MDWRDIPGESASIDVIYKSAIAEAVDGDIFVELGVFAGKSLGMLATFAKQADKRLHIVGVDLWEAADSITRSNNEGKNPYEPVSKADCESWLWKAGVRDKVTLVACDTAAAARQFMDGTVSLVFIDADHSFEGVKRDILAWWPKVRAGGIIAGHDFSHEYAGVMQAVGEAFPEYVHHEGGDTGICWVVRKV